MDKLERVARAMARARGLDPDADSGQGGWTRTSTQAEGVPSVTLERQAHPNWRLCEPDAAEFIAAHEALEQHRRVGD